MISAILLEEGAAARPVLFCNAMDEAFYTSADKALKNVMGIEAASHIGKLLECPRFAIVDGIGDTSLAIIQNLNARIQDLGRESIEAKHAHEKTQRELETSITIIKDLAKMHDKSKLLCDQQKVAQEQTAVSHGAEVRKLQDGIHMLKMITVCRNKGCNNRFNAMLDQDGLPPARWFVRCKVCQCRHEELSA